MKLKKIYAAILAAGLCMGTISATAFADGHNMMLQPVTSEEDTDNGGADNDTPDPDDVKPVLPLSPVTGDEENGDPSDENKAPDDEETPSDGSETGNDDKDNDPSDENKAPDDEETPSDGSGTGDKAKDDDPSTENRAPADEETPTNGSGEGDDNKDNAPSEENNTPDGEVTPSNGSGTGNSDNNSNVPPKTNDVSADNEAAANTAPTSPSAESSVGDNANGSADIKLGETVSVKSEALGGEVTVAADKDDTALEGAKLELAAFGKTETADKLNKIVDAEFGDAVKAAVTAVENGSAVALDIGFTKNGSGVQPTKDVTVTAPVPEDLKGAEKLFVYHVTKKGLDDVTSKCTYDKDNGTIAITNSVFSPYIISKTEIKVQTAAYDELKAYDDNFSTGVALAVAPIVVAGAFLAVVSLKKRR